MQTNSLTHHSFIDNVALSLHNSGILFTKTRAVVVREIATCGQFTDVESFYIRLRNNKITASRSTVYSTI
jgi:Fe2+ or Zn2+ uptake regulation protein